MRQRSDRLFIGVGGHVVALDPATGTELWRTKLKGSSFVTIWHSGNQLFAGANGELFCIDPSAGNILWQNRLKGLGMGVVAFATGSEVVVDSAVAAQRAAAASS